MFLTVKRLMALSLGTQREQLEHRTKPTWPRPFLLRPPLLRFLVWGCSRQHANQQHHPKVHPKWIRGIRLFSSPKGRDFGVHGFEIHVGCVRWRIGLTIFEDSVESEVQGRRWTMDRERLGSAAAISGSALPRPAIVRHPINAIRGCSCL